MREASNKPVGFLNSGGPVQKWVKPLEKALNLFRKYGWPFRGQGRGRVIFRKLIIPIPIVVCAWAAQPWNHVFSSENGFPRLSATRRIFPAIRGKTIITGKHQRKVLPRCCLFPAFEKVFHSFVKRLFQALFDYLLNHYLKVILALFLILFLLIPVCAVYHHRFTSTEDFTFTV